MMEASLFAAPAPLEGSMKSKLPLVCLLGIALTQPAVADTDAQSAFEECLTSLRERAGGHGLRASTLQEAFASIEYRPRIIELDRAQPEFLQTFWQYFSARATPERVELGRRKLAEHRVLLERIHADYGVRPEYIVAFWGLETNYGSFFGRTPVLDALATLACEGRRESFFTEQLIHALKIIDEGSIGPADMRGSWAGAMGHTQFMPSTFTAYAVDYDGSGRRDLWNSLPDAFASAANYLSSMGWKDGQRWGREVRLPADFQWSLAGLDQRHTLAEWQRLGVRQSDGAALPQGDIEASLLLPAGHRGPAFLVYDNFRIIMRWNASTSYALAVGHLADRIAGQGRLAAQPPADERALSREEVKEIQRNLVQLGHLEGDVDGIAGRETRAAIRRFQQTTGLPADGHPDPALLAQLRSAST
jgi:membrane-bound lytic murein transglycosylase B